MHGCSMGYCTTNRRKWQSAEKERVCFFRASYGGGKAAGIRVFFTFFMIFTAVCGHNCSFLRLSCGHCFGVQYFPNPPASLGYASCRKRRRLLSNKRGAEFAALLLLCSAPFKVKTMGLCAAKDLATPGLPESIRARPQHRLPLLGQKFFRRFRFPHKLHVRVNYLQ